MKLPATTRLVLTAVALTLIWCGLWGSVSVANAASGLALSTVALGAGRAASRPGGIRILPLLRFTWLVLVDLARSTVDVAREIVTPTDRTEEAIIAVDLPDGGNDHLLLLSSAITLSPGTAVVEANGDTGRLYVHLLHVHRRHEVEAHARELTELACAALPTSRPGAEA